VLHRAAARPADARRDRSVSTTVARARSTTDCGRGRSTMTSTRGAIPSLSLEVQREGSGLPRSAPLVPRGALREKPRQEFPTPDRTVATPSASGMACRYGRAGIDEVLDGGPGCACRSCTNAAAP
jgi:hypothetical protein